MSVEVAALKLEAERRDLKLETGPVVPCAVAMSLVEHSENPSRTSSKHLAVSAANALEEDRRQSGRAF